MSLAAQAAALGIPMKMIVDDGLRYSYCDAHEATLMSIEGDKALYQGTCNAGHHYEMAYEITELQKGVSIVNGELVYGKSKDFKAPSLEEY